MSEKHVVQGKAEAHGGRVVVFGYGTLAAAAVTALGSAGAHVIAVVAPSNRSGDDVDFIKQFARTAGIPVLVQPPRKAIAPFVQDLKRLDPDVIVVWSYPMILPRDVIEVPREGTVNVHGGLLPEYRGGHVMQWAIINGEPETGVALHYMDEGIDTGPIIAQRRFPIEPDDDAATVREKLKESGTALLTQWWSAISQGQAPKEKQNEATAKYYRLRTIDDGLINWDASGTEVCNLVRALVRPWPGAFTILNEKKLVIWKCRLLPEEASGEPGLVAHVDAEGARVFTRDRGVLIETAELDGECMTGLDLKRIMQAGNRLGRE